MRYKDYIESLKQLPHKDSNGRSIVEMYADDVEIWSNYACLGYARIAMQTVGVDEETERKIIKAMRAAFDDYTIDQAEKRY